jgi:hypothetical protein
VFQSFLIWLIDRNLFYQDYLKANDPVTTEEFDIIYKGLSAEELKVRFLLLSNSERADHLPEMDQLKYRKDRRKESGQDICCFCSSYGILFSPT